MYSYDKIKCNLEQKLNVACEANWMQHRHLLKDGDLSYPEKMSVEMNKIFASELVSKTSCVVLVITLCFALVFMMLLGFDQGWIDFPIVPSESKNYFVFCFYLLFFGFFGFVLGAFFLRQAFG